MDIPEEVIALVNERDDARTAKDFARADDLRAQIEKAGFVLIDTPQGARVEPKPAFEALAPGAIDDILGEPPTLASSVHVLYERYPGDLERFIGAMATHHDLADVEIVVVDNGSGDGETVEQLVGDTARVLHLDRELGWAAARNAGIKTSRGALIVLADLSIEPTGDVLAPLQEAFADPTVGVAGPFGLVSDDMRSWRADSGPQVHAIEGYLLAARRESFARELINERFKWYRNADIDLSFQVRAQGYRAVVVPAPVRKHTHRGWSALDEEERAKRSKRNHYTFFDRWKHRQDLLEDTSERS